MTGVLSPRGQAVLNIIVEEYISKAVPVASETVARNYKPTISSATIRNEMAFLEGEGYIARPHVSAGGIPSDKGYRYYVELLTKDSELPLAEQHFIRHSFEGVEKEFEDWIRLAAVLLARLVRNAALVTLPRSERCQFKHLEMVALQEYLALLVLVLYEARLKRQLLSFAEAITQEELTRIANKLNSAYSGLTSSQISTKRLNVSPKEELVVQTVVGMMRAEEASEYEEPHLEGLRLLLSQPEFMQSDRMLTVMELMEEKRWLKSVVAKGLSGEGVQVIIGKENEEETLCRLSLVFSGYGIPYKISGTIGVIGPTRMHYVRAIPAVRYLSRLLSGLVAEVYHGD